ncbi:MAG TPA: DUF2905 domain-containing protein, partial [Candidatus Binatus sp.]|nr:DUF2905 domain-containing protein [Candidatus Binatus sp.]
VARTRIESAKRAGRPCVARAAGLVQSEPGCVVAPIGKTLVFAGIAIVVIGLALWGLSSVPYVGRLPGDIYVRRGKFTLYFPIVTCIAISIVLTLFFSLLRR